MALNKVLLIGNVGKDPEVRHLESGAAVATITLATSERYRDRNGEMRELTEWHTVIAWRQLADLAENYIRKGSQIYVEGRIRTRSWDDQNGQKRYATEIQRIRRANIEWRNRMIPSEQEMRRIFAAIKARDAEEAAEAMRVHLKNIREALCDPDKDSDELISIYLK